ncbi:carbon-phosphorus lyase [Halarchaeum nitratireducens]|uniref:Carbon-phosphorus lyase n=1 Tax=Halarchaeum nitratireducens TaxID=489913 RepID=A0A830GEC0_9EURY|nr:carbon-phosphorus lyase [Halarchaeum nitratireducens]
MRALSVDPIHDTRETFRALVDAMSRPGTVQQTPAERSDHAVVTTLVDHEVTTHTFDEAVRRALESHGRFDSATPETADIVHTNGSPTWDVRDVRSGTLVEPSAGATVIYRVDALGPDATATTLRLTGPGVPDERTLRVSLPPTEVDAIADAQSVYPRGVDVVFAAADRISALPRSVTVEVV